jgi:hypothetical protein
METKVCTKCGVEKKINEFYNVPRGKFGVTGQCKECIKQQRRETNFLRKSHKQKWEKENKEKIKEQHRIYFQEHKEEYLNRQRKYRAENKDKVCSARRKYKNEKYNTDVHYKLLNNLRSRLRTAIKRNTKSGSTIERLGCSIEEFKLYLESKFQEGMTWENYGFYGWHIDHIIPCSKFDFSVPEEQKKCFHYTNLQPLWAKENLVKHNKIDFIRR